MTRKEAAVVIEALKPSATGLYDEEKKSAERIMRTPIFWAAQQHIQSGMHFS
jgi:hypothetical protein